MAIRNSKQETYKVKGDIASVKLMILKALRSGGFGNVKEIRALNQITATYKKLTVYGSITLTMMEEGDFVVVNADAVANVDNIYALFSSPTRKILNKFKEGF